MRHRVKSVKLGRTSQHRDLMLSNLAGSLIKHSRIKTTIAKAKALRPFAEKLVTLGKGGSLHQRRLAVSRLRSKDLVKKLFEDIAPRFKERKGGYTRILKLGPRSGADSAEMALIEWVDFGPAEAEAPVEAPAQKEEAKPADEKATKDEVVDVEAEEVSKGKE